MRKIAIAIFFVLSIVGCVFAADDELIQHGGTYDYVPEPRLQYPITDKVILTGKDSLEFKWWNDYMGIDHFIFKIYKGYNMYAPDLIYKQNLASNEYSINIKSELFEDYQVYTWSLIQVAFSGQKSDKSTSSFEVIKK